VIVLLCLVSIAVFLLVRGIFVHADRDATARLEAARTDSAGRATPAGVCQRCRSRLPFEAAFCARCGFPVMRQAPIPMPSQRTGRQRARGLVFVLIILLALIGFGAFVFTSHSQPRLAPPVQVNAPTDAW
jgi:hypothetical protein